jgi:predicted homoserine dehydrogenase-like protein
MASGATAISTSAVNNRLRQYEQQQTQLRSRFEERLNLIGDERKTELVKKIQSRMCVINQDRIEVMQKNLDKMSGILDKVEDRADKLKTEGKDISKITAAVTAARTKIEQARTAALNQAKLECVIDISGSEKNLGAEVRQGISDLQKQLSAVNEKVRLAKRAVSEAIVALAHEMGNPTPTKAAD